MGPLGHGQQLSLPTAQQGGLVVETWDRGSGNSLNVGLATCILTKLFAVEKLPENMKHITVGGQMVPH